MKLKGGGTFFVHQHMRILGYAEYSIYLLSMDQSKDYYFREYNISPQKKLYIASLRQLINDEIDNNQQIDNEYKLSLKKQLLETVKEIDSLISSYYYLKMTQDFQHSNY